MSDASEYPATDGDPVKPEKDGHTMTDVLTALAQRIVDGHPYSTATAGQLTITALVDPDPETDPGADNPDAYTYTHEAIAAFRRGDWTFTTITLSIDTHGVQARAVQRGVDRALAAPDGERDYLAGPLLPALLAEVAGNLHAATDAVDIQTGFHSMTQQPLPSRPDRCDLDFIATLTAATRQVGYTIEPDELDVTVAHHADEVAAWILAAGHYTATGYLADLFDAPIDFLHDMAANTPAEERDTDLELIASLDTTRATHRLAHGFARLALTSACENLSTTALLWPLKPATVDTDTDTDTAGPSYSLPRGHTATTGGTRHG